MKRFLICILLTVIFLSSAGMTNGLENSAAKNNADNQIVRVPILMYHSVLPDKARVLPYCIRLKDFIADLEYIEQNGYTTITVKDLVDYTEKRTALPKKPVILSFDDGHYNMLSLVLPELIKRNMKAICAVVDDFSQNKAYRNNYYGYLSYDDIKQLHDSKAVELACHTHNLHRLSKRQGAKKIKNESEHVYKQIFTNDIKAQLDKLNEYGIRPITMVYPFGLKSYYSDEYLKELGFKASFGCVENVNYITKNPNCLFWLCRYRREQRSAKQILEKIQRLY